LDLWARLKHFELGWSGLAALTTAFVVVLFLRRRLPPSRRHRGRVSVLLLGLGPVLHLVATGIRVAGAPGVSNTLHITNLFLVMLGVAGAVGMVFFDLALGRSQIPTIVRDVSQTVVFGVIVFVVFRSGGLNPLSVLTTSAVATAVIGLALQGVIANLFAGLLLQFEQTIALEDWIQISGRVGRITEIRWRSSTLLNREGDVTIVPNLQLLTQEVVNLSRPTRARRVTVRVPFAREHSPGEVDGALCAAVQSIEGVLAEPPPRCTPLEYGRTDIVYAISFWVTDAGAEEAVESAVRRRIWYVADRTGLHESSASTTAGPAATDGVVDVWSASELAVRTSAIAMVSVFAPLDDNERTTLAWRTRRRRFEAGEVILRRRDPGSSLFVVASGEVGVLAADGRGTVAKLGTGEYFGEMSLLLGDARHATCTALRETVTYEIESGAMRDVMTARPKIADDMAELLTARETQLAGARESSTLSDPDERSARRAHLFARVRDYFHLA